MTDLAHTLAELAGSLHRVSFAAFVAAGGDAWPEKAGIGLVAVLLVGLVVWIGWDGMREERGK